MKATVRMIEKPGTSEKPGIWVQTEEPRDMIVLCPLDLYGVGHLYDTLNIGDKIIVERHGAHLQFFSL